MPYYTHQAAFRNIKSILSRGLDPDYSSNTFSMAGGTWVNKVKGTEFPQEDINLTKGKYNKDEIVIFLKTNLKAIKEDDLGYTIEDLIPPKSFISIAYRGKVYSIFKRITYKNWKKIK